MSGFLSRLYAQQSQVLVFRPYLSPNSVQTPTVDVYEESSQSSEEQGTYLPRTKKRPPQANLLSEWAEMQVTPTVYQTAVLEPRKYPETPLPAAALESPGKKVRRHFVLTKAKQVWVCQICRKNFGSAKSKGGHVARNHPRKTALKSAV